MKVGSIPDVPLGMCLGVTIHYCEEDCGETRDFKESFKQRELSNMNMKSLLLRILLK
jgi:hypothetical protein